MLRRKKKEHRSSDGAGPDPAGTEAGAEASGGPPPGTGEPVTQAHDGAGPGDDAIAMAEQPAAVAEDPSALDEESSAPPEPTPSAEPAASTSGPPPPPPSDGDFAERLPASFYFEGVIKPERVPTREELERQAEADFRAAIAPSLEPLRELVPDASSPDEAMRVLAERQGEAVVDEEGANLSSRDIYRKETSVYYRIRTHFDKPSRRPGLRREWQPPSGLAAPQRESSGRRSSR